MQMRSWLFSACAALSFASTSTTADVFRDATQPTKEHGILLLSITRQGMLSSYRVLFRQVGRETSSYVENGCNQIGPRSCFHNDFKQLGLEGQLLAAELLPGEYEIFSWGVVAADCARIEATTPFSMKFHVQPGRITYAGNFHFTQTAKRALVVTGAQVDYGRYVERDLAILRLKYPALRPDLVDISGTYPGVLKLGGDGSARFAIPCGQWAHERAVRTLPSELHPEPKPAYGPR